MTITDLFEARKDFTPLGPDLPKRKTFVPLEKAQEFLQKKCPVAFNSPFKIYRGVPLHGAAVLMFGDSSKNIRTSANTMNFYTEIIDNILPNWKGYPKRSRSFICSSSRRGSRAYGSVYQVYPLGDPIIGICPREDFWASFSNRTYSLGLFANFFIRCAKIVGIDPDEIPAAIDTPENIKDIISRLDTAWTTNNVQRRAIESRISLFLSGEHPSNFESFTQFLMWFFNPKQNGFEMGKLSSLASLSGADGPDGKELWFSGPAYFLKVSDY